MCLHGLLQAQHFFLISLHHPIAFGAVKMVGDEGNFCFIRRGDLTCS
jgi:hypothetical protein